MRNSSMSWKFVGLGAGVMGVVVAMASVPADARAAEGRTRQHDRSAAASIEGAYAFYYAVRAGSGFIVAGANHAPVPCGGTAPATACFVSGFDFGPMALPASASHAILKEVWSDPRAVKLLFAGRVEGEKLKVWEAWRAPVAVPTSLDLVAVSHPSEQALVLNDWHTTTLGALDFAHAPLAPTCDVVNGQACTPTLDAPTVQVREPAGIILAGTRARRGTFRVDYYFLDVSTGVTQSGDGYSYCTEGQFLCASNQKCTAVENNCSMVHGRIRGLIDYPTLPTDPTFQEWQVATGQLTASDLAATSPAP
jgi:hypothetical protein